MKIRTLSLAAVLATGIAAATGHAQDAFKLAIMQAAKGDAAKYAPMVPYLKAKGIDLTIVSAGSYKDAATMFQKGGADGMFSGSGVAGTMIIKALARPVAKPIPKDGVSTYWAVVLAKKGSPAFDGKPEYFDKKKVLCCGLASSGEFFLNSVITGTSSKPEILKALNHQAAIQALDKGAADCAVVKNRIWDKEAANFPNLEKVGEDKGENPDNCLILANAVKPETEGKIVKALLDLEADTSEPAVKLKESLGVTKFVKAGKEDYEHNLILLKKAGVDEKFEF